MNRAPFPSTTPRSARVVLCSAAASFKHHTLKSIFNRCSKRGTTAQLPPLPSETPFLPGNHFINLIDHVFQRHLHQPFPDQPRLPRWSWRGRRQRSWHDDPRYGRGGEEQAGCPSHGTPAPGASCGFSCS
ncbi:hypothetical protein WJX74_008952 [Apatococcus lobatus]|uniref:Uncharacterized protein n=2 Tax=Apatococcus TaxID=904362 RepID=A0AAW1RRN0_9CHLO